MDALTLYRGIDKKMSATPSSQQRAPHRTNEQAETFSSDHTGKARCLKQTKKSTHRPVLPSIVVPFHHSPSFSSTRIIPPARNPISSVSCMVGGDARDRPRSAISHAKMYATPHHTTPHREKRYRRVYDTSVAVCGRSGVHSVSEASHQVQLNVV